MLYWDGWIWVFAGLLAATVSYAGVAGDRGRQFDGALAVACAWGVAALTRRVMDPDLAVMAAGLADLGAAIYVFTIAKKNSAVWALCLAGILALQCFINCGAWFAAGGLTNGAILALNILFVLSLLSINLGVRSEVRDTRGLDLWIHSRHPGWTFSGVALVGDDQARAEAPQAD